jgi:nucleoside-diphosphate-sugar epimerase
VAAVPSTTIVTGANGWLGRALLNAFTGHGDPSLERAGSIRALVHTPTDVPEVLEISDRVEVHVGDVTDRRALSPLFADAEGATVIHTAGVIHPRRVAEFVVNAVGTKAVAECASAARIGRFVHVSSNSPFGVNSAPDDTFRAHEPYRPYLGYGRSKMEAELVIRDAVDAGAVDAVIVRPPWFYGPFQPARQTSFFRLVRRGLFPLFGTGEHRRSMVYIDNLVDGIVRAEQSRGGTGKAYWIADARPYAMTEIVSTVKRALADEGLPVADRQVRVPRLIGAIAQKVDGFLQERGRYQQEIHVLGELNETIACDITAARTDLGYEPEIDLADGMRRSVRWCLERGITL